MNQGFRILKGEPPEKKNKLVSKVEIPAQGSVRDFFNRSCNKVDLWVISTQQLKPIHSQGLAFVKIIMGYQLLQKSHYLEFNILQENSM